MENFQITEPPKVWVPSFPSVNGNGISALAIMKKLKNGCHIININHTEKFQITDPPPKFGSPIYPISQLCVVLHFLIFVQLVICTLAYFSKG